MFFGEYQHAIDTKGRLILPAKFREELGEEFYMSKGPDSCIVVYTKEEWEKTSANLRNLNLSSREARAYMRQRFAGAAELSTDKQGRVLLPQNLRQFAKIDKNATIIGVASRVEIWATEVWEAYNDDPSLNFDEVFDKLDQIDY